MAQQLWDNNIIDEENSIILQEKQVFIRQFKGVWRVTAYREYNMVLNLLRKIGG